MDETVAVDCGEPEPTTPVPDNGSAVSIAVSCLAGNGRVDANVVNTGSEAAMYRLEFEGLSPRQYEPIAAESA